MMSRRFLSGIGAFFLILPTGIWAHEAPLFVPNALRPASTVEAVGLEELQSRLLRAGLEEKIFRAEGDLTPDQRGVLCADLNRRIVPALRASYTEQVRKRQSGGPQQAVTPLPPDAYKPVPTVDIRRATLTPEILGWGGTELSHTAIFLQAGGGGARLLDSLPEEFKKKWTGRFSKPTTPVGVLEEPIIQQILLGIDEVAIEWKVRDLPVFIGVSGDTRKSVIEILKRAKEKGISFESLKIYLVDQPEYPVWNEKGQIVWELDESVKPKLRTSAVGTLAGVMVAHVPVQSIKGEYQKQTPLELSIGRERFLFLNGDDPVLYDRDFLLGVLGASAGTDVLSVGVARQPRFDAQGQIIGFGPDGGRIVLVNGKPMIIELTDSNPHKPVAHRNLDAAEATSYATRRRGFTFNLGALVLSRQAFEATLNGLQQGLFPPHPTEPKVAHIRTQTADGQMQEIPSWHILMEFFITDILELIGGQPGMVTIVAELEFERYGAVKEWSLLHQNQAKLYQGGRSRIQRFGGTVASQARVQFSPAWDNPHFTGQVGPDLQVQGSVGVSFERDRVLVRRLEPMPQTVRLVETPKEQATPGEFQKRASGLFAKLLQAHQIPDSALLEVAEPILSPDAQGQNEAVIAVTVLEPIGDPIELFKMPNGEPLVLPPHTVIDPSTGPRLPVVGSAQDSAPRADQKVPWAPSTSLRTGLPVGLHVEGEGVKVGTPQAVAGSDAVEVISVSVAREGRQSHGRAIVFDPSQGVIRQIVNPDVVGGNWDWKAIRGKSREEQPGRPLASLIANPTQWGPVDVPEGYQFAAGTNSLQTNFWESNGFVVKGGKPFSILGVRWSVEPWVFVLDKGQLGLRKLPIVDEIPDISGIQDAITTPVLIADGRDVSAEILQYPIDTPLLNQVVFPPGTTAAFSAIARTSGNRLIEMALAGEPGKGIPQASLRDMAQALLAVGEKIGDPVVEGGLLGGSMDVQQWVEGDGNTPAVLGRHNNPPHQAERHLNAALLFYLPARTGLEEIDRWLKGQGWREPSLTRQSVDAVLEMEETA